MVFNRRSEAKPGAGPGLDVSQSPLQPSAPLESPAAAFPSTASAPASSAAPLGGFAALPESVIGNDFTIEGNSITIRCKGSLRINGNIDASLHARKLVVGESAAINGTMTADNIAVYGRVSGAINGERVVLGKSAEVLGDIVSRYLEVEPGATFEGRSRRVKDAAEITPQLDPVSGASTSSNAAEPSPVLMPPGSRLG